MNNELASTDQPTTKKRWWLFFTIFILLTASCLPFVIQYQHQISLVKRIEQAGGRVISIPVGPEWLRNALGEQRMRGFEKLTEIGLFYAPVTDDWLQAIAELTSLELLSLYGTEVTDVDLIHLEGLTKLEWLNLNDTRITDAGLSHLKKLSNLEVLWLEYTRVSNSGVEELQAALPDCQIIYSRK